MWLLDVNLPKKIGGLQCRRPRVARNGALVETAQQAGFQCVLTRDRLFGESAARTLKRFPAFCVVLVTIPRLRGPEFLDHFRSAWVRSPIQLVAGQLLRWPVD